MGDYVFLEQQEIKHLALLQKSSTKVMRKITQPQILEQQTHIMLTKVLRFTTLTNLSINTRSFTTIYLFVFCCNKRLQLHEPHESLLSVAET